MACALGLKFCDFSSNLSPQLLTKKLRGFWVRDRIFWTLGLVKFDDVFFVVGTSGQNWLIGMTVYIVHQSIEY